MSIDVLLGDAANLPVRAWRVAEGELRLQFAESAEDRTLRCDGCERRHWIVQSHVHEGRGALAVRSHGCGRASELFFAEVPAPWR